MSLGFNNIQDVLVNYKSAIYEKNVERFVSAYASDIHIYDCWETGREARFLNRGK